MLSIDYIAIPLFLLWAFAIYASWKSKRREPTASLSDRAEEWRRLQNQTRRFTRQALADRKRLSIY